MNPNIAALRSVSPQHKAIMAARPTPEQERAEAERKKREWRYVMDQYRQAGVAPETIERIYSRSAQWTPPANG